MRKIGIILLSVIMVVSLAACNSGGGKTKKVKEEQTESVKPTEEATESVKSTEEATETAVSIQEEAATETVTGAVSQEDNKKADSNEQQDEKLADSGNQHSKSAEVEQAAGNNGKDNSDNNGSDNSNSGDDNGTANAPADSGNAGQDSGSQQTPQTAVAYSPQNVVSLATAKCQAGGMITTQQNLDNLLAQGKITQDEYNEYYPYDGMEESYYSVFVEADLNKASTIDGQRLPSEDSIAQYIADMLMLEKDPIFYISYDGIYSTGGTDFYEFRCHR